MWKIFDFLDRQRPARNRPATDDRPAAEIRAERMAAAEAASAESRQRVQLAREIATRIQAGTATPEADAEAAAARGDYGLMAMLTGPGHQLRMPGVTCSTPGGAPPRIRALLSVGCVRTEATARWAEYAEVYNRRLVGLENFPHADICRPTDAGGSKPGRPGAGG